MAAKSKRALPGAEVFTAAALVEYQEGSVVSREIVDAAKGSVTVFAFDEGEGLSEHSAPFDALVQILEGTAHIGIAGERHTVSAGQIILMPANVPHALDAPERFKMMLVMIRE